MINQQLLDYVRGQRAAGLSKELIISALAGGGWTAEDVHEALAAIEGVSTPQPPQPRVITPPIPAFNPNAGSLSATSPLITRSPTAIPERKKRKKGGLRWFLLFLFLLVLGAAAAWVYLNPTILGTYIPQL